ncbi:MAG: c-type cytochrome [Terriglobales bacterium]|jgi:mono/diheme cytochrome c family protein
MRTPCPALLAATVLLVPCIALNSGPAFGSANSPVLSPALRLKRSSSSDLEVGGEIAGLPSGTTRYLSREDLLALPQATYTVTDDPNFSGPTQVRGVLLEELIRYLGAAPDSNLVVAICRDRYRANYPRAYVAAHDPLLVLTINGKPPASWPKDAEGHDSDMGPYMITHPRFTPSFKILSHEDEPQIPWGVVRLEIRDEKVVVGAIAPSGPHAADPVVQAGYRIAQQNCFRCHNMGNEGGRKSGFPWPVLSAFAAATPEDFVAYVHNPQAKNSQAQMPANPEYDDATMRALLAYFQTFSADSSVQRREKQGNDHP